MNPLERYRAIIPDWEGFQETMLRRDPPTLRVRTGRISTVSLKDRLQAQGFVLSEVEGLPDFLRVMDGPNAVADTLENWLGLFYIQQASTGVAAPLLGPRPGERVLDLCAAPGGKTTHAADLMQDRGCIVAVDRNEDRIRALLGNMYRTAHPNVLVVAGDGRSLPDGALFDRVLVDAPCSAEGTLRRKRGKARGQTAKFHKQAPRRQEALLRRAIDLTRPGGAVLYSTCTFAPEENEAVVDRVLKDAPVTLDPITIEVPHAPGLTSFEDQTFDPSLEGACRIYPHHFDSGDCSWHVSRGSIRTNPPAPSWTMRRGCQGGVPSRPHFPTGARIPRSRLKPSRPPSIGWSHCSGSERTFGATSGGS